MTQDSPPASDPAADAEMHGGGAGAPTHPPGALGPRLRHAGRQTRRVVVRVASKAWADSIFAKSATAAFWQTLSLAPLLLGLLGSLGYVGGWFGPDTVGIVESKILTFSRDLFSEAVVSELIQPTVTDVLGRGRGAVVSVGFVLSLWAGSSAMATFVDAIVEAHDQQDARHPVWQRVFALLLYVQFLVAAVFILPLVALGPSLIGRILPGAWREPGLRLVDSFYYPAVGLLLIVGLTTLYKAALHRSLPWHRLFGGALVAGVFFMAASEGLRRYLSWVTATGVSYGALATPIAFLLFTFFLGFAVILGAEFNATVQEFWPARATRIEQMREWLANQVRGETAPEPEEPTEDDADARPEGLPAPGGEATSPLHSAG
ncbi:YihY/virulence factor BrkB family protein [Nocardia farcinica]|uniref:YihY family inner membrane protein n=1 Tax=Nocardia farcinica TaxID=37329 RepID=A0A0H5NDK4_NOCFR|nr:YihY/virulence factor BrkB family protein [Nocardia farcinica]AXK88757.1 YihY/virulence factor BrkB family protein [Nocardia farcinica]MBF6256806.1 YihY/virulence factor BrkB family protein [Nocardia farcinica]CRY73429.1 YihY family inner membrane protein [Nocardia farcinica]SIT29421.1 membrane protein [Nocardia farcinica]